jgi:hypothetical protein
VTNLLRGQAAAFVVVNRSDSPLDHALAGHPIFELFRWPAAGPPRVRVLSNHPRLEWPARTAVALDGLHVQMDGAHLLRMTGEELVFLAEPGRSAVSIVNRSAVERTIRVRFTRPRTTDLVAQRHLAPRASWRAVWIREPPRHPKDS